MKNSIVSMFLLLVITSCGQEKKPKIIATDIRKGTNPKIEIKVNKKYDDKGNLVKIDSTYSYYYTSRGLDSSKVVADSVFSRFKTYFDENFSSAVNKEMKDIFMNDSLFKYDFTNDDFFTRRFKLNEEKMNELFRQMDSVKNIYLREPHKDVNKKLSFKK